jgi:hypothetical protein
VGTNQKDIPQKLQEKKGTRLACCTSLSKQTDLIYSYLGFILTMLSRKNIGGSSHLESYAAGCHPFPELVLTSSQKLTLGLLATITPEVIPFRAYAPFPTLLPFFKCILEVLFCEGVQHCL